jgi:uncharacterized repeat protein (TIGR01451 family)
MKPIFACFTVLVLGAQLAWSQDRRIFYPSEENAILMIEQRGGTNLQAGAGYEYALHIRNLSGDHLHNVRVHQSLSESFQIESESIESQVVENQRPQTRQTGPQAGPAQPRQMQQQPRQMQQQRQQLPGQQPQQDQEQDLQLQVQQRIMQLQQARGNPDSPTSGIAPQDRPDVQNEENLTDLQLQVEQRLRQMRQTRQAGAPQAQEGQDLQMQVEARIRELRHSGDIPGGGMENQRPPAGQIRDQQAGAAGTQRQPGTPQQAPREAAQTRRPQPQQAQHAQHAQQDDQPMIERVWHIGALGPREERQIRVTGIPTQEGAINSCVFATFERALCTTLQVTRPELRLTRQWVDGHGREAERFFICDPVRVRYTILNEGTGTTRQTVITEQLPDGITTNDGASEIQIEVGELRAGQSETYLVGLTVNERGQFSGRAMARAGNLSTRSNARSIQFDKAEIDVSIQGRASQYIDRDVEYQITVTNLSDEVPALNTRVRIPGIDERMRFAATNQAIPANVDVFTIGTLPPGESRSFGIVFTSREAAQVATRVDALAYCADTATTNISTEFVGVPALEIVVVDRVDPVAVGEQTTYIVTVRNEGSAVDGNITLVGELPQNLEFIDALGDTEVRAEGNRLEFDPVEQLAPGERVTWTINVRGAEAGQGEFEINAQSDSGTFSSGEPTTVY